LFALTNASCVFYFQKTQNERPAEKMTKYKIKNNYQDDGPHLHGQFLHVRDTEKKRELNNK
jgi:hypothetical protein